jgi:transposase
MKKDYYIGVDIPKKSIDVAIYVKNHTSKLVISYETFQNGNEGFKEMNRWLGSKGVTISKSFFCMEATGTYTYELCQFLEEHKVPYSVQSPLHLKRSFGLTHGKNDKVDAGRIAYYAYLHREDIKVSRLASDSVRKLKSLAYRSICRLKTSICCSIGQIAG